ncbi:MAG: threonylcarbamoyl-AMP synthase [Chloroflexi bacterium]|uniref:L-threonylcarbamoyladenylate synthase n=1 Tax=Candidatus Chlorohelix allophototropha TaxID=3003348 RepID=A0A8T7M5J2_9CHLR|nr:threonylcarbamoyl-AMP synthase [Chloroflexota bacterium]WJW69246.1 threonylcarbamoyl-AMP synthase [Chloroflexota bacterium L227-S17]
MNSFPANLKTRIINADDARAISIVADEIRRGNLAAFPTDTVYGVGAIASNAEAVTRLYNVKGRRMQKPIPILVKDAEQLLLVAREVNDLANRLIERFWPGALTLILPRHPDLPDVICAGGDTIAVRMPAHVLTLALIREVGSPLATTSANQSGKDSPLDVPGVLINLKGRIEVVLDGGMCPGGIDSTVVDTTGGVLRVLRETAIPARVIREALK